MAKVVLDTNVLVSGFNFPGSKPARILGLVAAGELAKCISEPILDETARILAGKFRWTPAAVAEAIFWLRTFSVVVTPRKRLAVLNDEPDNRILECAVTGKVDFIITGDKHLLGLKVYRGMKVVTPAGFLDIFSVN